jgi:hypothetical protein
VRGEVRQSSCFVLDNLPEDDRLAAQSGESGYRLWKRLNQIMRWLLNLIGRLFEFGRGSEKRHRLMGMYFDESNSRGRRKPNRERA